MFQHSGLSCAHSMFRAMSRMSGRSNWADHDATSCKRGWTVHPTEVLTSLSAVRCKEWEEAACLCFLCWSQLCLRKQWLLYRAAQFYKAVDGLRLSVFGYLINTSNMWTWNFFFFYTLKIVKVGNRGRPIIGADIKHFTDYRYRPF